MALSDSLFRSDAPNGASFFSLLLYHKKVRSAILLFTPQNGPFLGCAQHENGHFGKKQAGYAKNTVYIARFLCYLSVRKSEQKGDGMETGAWSRYVFFYSSWVTL